MSGIRPLYRPLCHETPEFQPQRGNAGLWYDKYCDQWCRDPQRSWSLKSFKDDQQECNPKLDWIETLTIAQGVGVRQDIGDSVERLEDLCLARAGLALYRKTTERFVTGLGREHPVENGFAWHQTLGVPYLPGSSVKGLVREWAAEWLGAAETELLRILGPVSEADVDARGTGSVVFLDALPIRQVLLEPEVMTPHYRPYYEDESQMPGDWHSPVPIPFLAVATNQSFFFGVLPRHADANSDCATASAWLDEALRELGAGAKTAVGFGRFDVDRKAQARWASRSKEVERAAERDARTAADSVGKSELAVRFIAERNRHGWVEDKNAFLTGNSAESWLDVLEATPDAEALELFEELLDRHFKGVLEHPDMLKGKKKEFHFKARPRALAHRCLILRAAPGDADG